jgi:hypothetical protein
MRRRQQSPVVRTGAFGALVLLVMAAPPLASRALGNSAGPLDGLTGAPGEMNCTACHGSFPVNSGSGLLTVDGFPPTYAPGQDYNLEVRLADPDASRWGFEFTILDAQGQSAGALANVGPGTQISTGGLFLRTYAKHDSLGTRLGQTGQSTWPVRWTAPAAGAGPLTLYAAGNAANASFTFFGDRIYTNSAASAEGVASSVPGAALAADLSNHPNPFNPATTVRFSLEQDADVALHVYDVTGRRLATVVQGRFAAGGHDVRWDGRDDAGRRQPSGLYFARLTDGAGRPLAQPLKMVMTK